jgi:hypothetical protein
MAEEKRRRTYYGVSIGILMLETYFERFVGDIGNARTWPFPVQYRIVKGASPDRIVGLADEAMLQPFKDAADELVAAGVDGITTTCGFLALYQRELAAHCPVPVATSALLQVAMVARTLPSGKRPAILTFSKEALTRRHLEGAGADPATPVFGMPPASEFQRSIRAGDTTVSIGTLRREVLAVAEAAVASDRTIGALVLECTNLSPYAADLKARLGLPVFDMVTLVHWLHRSLRPEAFVQD